MSQAKPIVAWSRLVRYKDENGTVKYGEPVSDEASFEDGKVEVRICEGSSIFDAKPTSEVEVAHKLVGPLTPQDVPIIRCIGLNYRTHSKPLNFAEKTLTHS